MSELKEFFGIQSYIIELKATFLCLYWCIDEFKVMFLVKSIFNEMSVHYFGDRKRSFANSLEACRPCEGPDL